MELPWFASLFHRQEEETIQAGMERLCLLVYFIAKKEI